MLAPRGGRQRFAKITRARRTGLNWQISGLFLRIELGWRWVLLDRCWTASGHTFGHSGVDTSGVAVDCPERSIHWLAGQARKHPTASTDHRLNRVLLLYLHSGCVPNVSRFSTFDAGCPRREEIERRPVA
jgi:hypothetical protein